MAVEDEAFIPLRERLPPPFEFPLRADSLDRPGSRRYRDELKEDFFCAGSDVGTGMLSTKVEMYERGVGRIAPPRRVVDVFLRPWALEVPFQLSFHECPSSGAESLTHVTIFVPNSAGGDPDKEFWTRVFVYYQQVRERTLHEKGMSPDLRRSVHDSEALALIGLCFPQRLSAIPLPVISKKTLDNARRSGKRSLQPAPPTPEHSASAQDVFKIAAAVIGEKQLQGTESRQRYGLFEKELIQEHDKLQSDFQGKPDAVERVARKLRAHLEKARKKATPEMRENLRWLRAACDTALMDMYQYVAEGVHALPELGDALDRTSLNYFGFVHAVQDRLGGIVPATFPIWSLLLNSPAFVDALISYSANPGEAKATARLDSLLVGGLLMYADLIQLERGAGRVAEQLDKARASRNGEMSEDFRQAPSRPDLEAGANELMAVILGLGQDDPDIRVLIDTVVCGLTVKECGDKYQCSIGQVTKMAKRGAGKARRLLAERGIDEESLDLFGWA